MLTTKKAFELIFGEHGIHDAGYPIFETGAQWERAQIELILKRFIDRHADNGAYANAARMILNSVRQRKKHERQRCEEPGTRH